MTERRGHAPMAWWLGAKEQARPLAAVLSVWHEILEFDPATAQRPAKFAVIR